MVDGNRIFEVNQFLTFTIGEDVFALEITRVREVIDHIDITKVPRMPGHLRGVINLRGNILSVIDLAMVLGMQPIEKTEDKCIVIVEVKDDGNITRMGALADSVREVIHLDPDRIDPTPRVGMKLDPDFILGIGKRNDSFIIILDIDDVLSDDHLLQVEKTNEKTGSHFAG